MCNARWPVAASDRANGRGLQLQHRFLAVGLVEFFRGSRVGRSRKGSSSAGQQLAAMAPNKSPAPELARSSLTARPKSLFHHLHNFSLSGELNCAVARTQSSLSAAVAAAPSQRRRASRQALGRAAHCLRASLGNARRMRRAAAAARLRSIKK